MNKILFLVCVSAIAIMSLSCTQNVCEKSIRVDQCGYMKGHPKMAFIEDNSEPTFSIIDVEKKVVFEGNVGTPALWPEANEIVSKLDFSEFDTEGKYQIVVGQSVSDTIFISENPYMKLALDVVRAFYYNRSGIAIDATHGGRWSRAAGHPDTNVIVHTSAASETRPEGFILSSPGGWYDAGDYNKYIVNSGISTYTLLLAATMYNSMASQVDLNIPESGDDIPDLIDEALYNLRWMLTMQDPNDGGVYHKLTSLNFEDFIRPNECKKQRYVVTKTTTAALDLAATAAYASRTLSCYPQLAPLCDSCINVARRAFDWAMTNPIVYFRNPEGVSTGDYGDMNVVDEKYWAATELWLATGEAKYFDVMNENFAKWDVPTWGDVGMLATYSLSTSDVDNEQKTEACKQIIEVADNLLSIEQQSAVSFSLVKYDWGSNSSVANIGMLKLIAYRMTGNVKYYESAINDLHYILGRNATGYCFVTGQSIHSPRHIHHRISESDGIDDPVPGFLAGGPNTVVKIDCPDIERSIYPAKAYSDVLCSYSTNEIAINWNAPMTFLVWGIISNE